MLVSDFDYELPEELIAQEPLADRSASRMLIVDRAAGTYRDAAFNELPAQMKQGDVLVLNNSRVFPSRLYGVRSGGTARIEVFLLRPVSEDERTWRVLVRPGRKVPVGEHIRFAETCSAEVLDRGDHGQRMIRFQCEGSLFDILEAIGHVPLPPYIRREDRPDDRSRYNTVYSQTRGSVAAPTAGLHFTPEILAACRAAGAEIAYVTLHVGLGTFAPVHTEKVDDIQLHSERYSVTTEAGETIRQAGRRIAVGTTSVRTLETVYGTGMLSGETNLFLYPGAEFRAVDSMLTNFHLPKSSLLMLVSAFAGHKLIRAAYRHAVESRYRFYSYGDCMLIL